MHLEGKRIYGMSYASKSLMLLLFFSTSLYAADSSNLEFNGLQMAWVKLPRETATEEKAPVSKAQTSNTKTPAVAPTPSLPAQSAPPVIIVPIKPVPQPAPPALAAPIKPAAAQPIMAPPKPIKLVPASPSVSKPVDRVNPSTTPAKVYSAAELQWVIGLGIDIGGDELGKVYFADGSTKAVNANQGYVLNMGALIQNGKSRTFSTQLSVGYKLGGQWGDNGSVTWRSIPIEVIEFYQAGSMRVGLGLGYQLKPRLEVSIPSSSYTDQYNNALGVIAQFGWSPAKEPYSIDLRYTAVKYQPSSTSNTTTVKGNVVGLYASYKF